MMMIIQLVAMTKPLPTICSQNFDEIAYSLATAW